ncbi:hypothetical protein [Castellaniella caeni]|uniref:hypothetical protein n=1 Tax=Castellaniella caeni TaxID=266123 RepID=UPI0012ECD7D4|nr:hypothetical protein [Castellaniella caeni]
MNKRAGIPIGALIVFSVVFLFANAIGFLFQFVVIPLGSWDAGSGLLVGGDWVYFHRLALNLVDNINRSGWAAWGLRPSGQAVSGIAAFLYKITGVSKPWVMLPLNSFLYGLIAVFQYLIFRKISGSAVVASVCVSMLFVFPSFILTYAQLSKDIFSIFGFIVILYVFVCCCYPSSGNYKGVTYIILLLTISNLSIWVVRPYALKFALVSESVCFALLVFFKFFCCKHFKLINGFLSIVITSAFIFAPSSSLEKHLDGAEAALEIKDAVGGWVGTPALGKVDRLFEDVARTRRVLIYGYPDAGSNIDSDVNFNKAGDVVKYVPRALQIGLFAPFPEAWFRKGRSPGASAMIVASAAEVSMLYVMYLGILLWFLVWLFSVTLGGFKGVVSVVSIPSAVIIFLFSISWLLIYCLISPNVGTIYRLRLPVMLVFLGLGATCWGGLYKYLMCFDRLSIKVISSNLLHPSDHS